MGVAETTPKGEWNYLQRRAHPYLAKGVIEPPPFCIKGLLFYFIFCLENGQLWNSNCYFGKKTTKVVMCGACDHFSIHFDDLFY